MTRAEKLREAIEAADAPGVSHPDWAADMPTRVVRAIVHELGITREMVEDVETGAVLLGFAKESPECPLTDVRNALAALLDAAGLP